jgi:hypothetical protein
MILAQKFVKKLERGGGEGMGCCYCIVMHIRIETKTLLRQSRKMLQMLC